MCGYTCGASINDVWCTPKMSGQMEGLPHESGRESGGSRKPTRSQLYLTVSKFSFNFFFLSFHFPAVFAPLFIFYSPARAVPPDPVYSLRCLAQSSLRRWSLHSTPTTANPHPPRPLGKGLSRVSLWGGSSLWPAHRQQVFEGTFLIVRISRTQKAAGSPIHPACVLRLACRV